MRRVGSQVQTVGVQSLRNQHLMHTLKSKVSGWYLLTCKSMESPDTGQVWLQCPGCLLLLMRPATIFPIDVGMSHMARTYLMTETFEFFV